MAATSATSTIKYPVTDTANDVVEEESLQTELEALSFTEIDSIDQVEEQAGSIVVTFSYDASDGADLDADLAAIQAAIDVHAGEPLGITHQTWQTQNPPSELSVVAADFGGGDDYEFEDRQTTPLKSGEYEVKWHVEVESTDATNDFTIQAHTHPNNTNQLRAEDRFEGIQHRVVSGWFVTTKDAGQKQSIRLILDKTSGTVVDNTVKLRQLRVSVTKLVSNGG